MLINSIPIINYNKLNASKLNVVGLQINFNELSSNEFIEDLLKIDYPFFLSIKVTSLNIEDINIKIHNLISVTFKLNYIKENKKPLLLFYSEQQTPPNLKSTLINAFTNQGYEGINLYEIIKNDNQLTNNFDFKYIDNNELNAQIKELYESFSLNSIDQKVFIKTTPEEIDHNNKTITEADLKFAQLNEKLYVSYKNIQELRNQNNKLKSTNISLQTEVENFTTNQKLLKEDASNIINWYKNEVDKIKKWYLKEYEVLPSWYKKIGHIIKKFKKQKEVD